MARIALINPPAQGVANKYWKQVSGVLPPIGLGYLAGALDAGGHEVAFIDANAEDLSDEAILTRLKACRPDLIGITVTSLNAVYALRLSEKVKAHIPHSRIILGGVHPTVMPDQMLENPAVDFVFRGEAEKGLVQLASGEPLPSIDNLSYKDNGKTVHNKFVIFNDDLDDLPMPAYHLMPINRYRPSLGNYKSLPGMGIISSRGCPGKCTFCYVGVNGTRVRYRSPESVVEEIKILYHGWGVREISFYDDNFTTSKSRVIEFCNLLLKNGLDITWTCASRVDTINEDMLRLMARSGCHQISFGVESGDPEILKTIRKNIDLDKAKAVISLTEKCGIEPKIYLMVGNPGETEASMRKTLDFALDSDAIGFMLSIVTPYPGTEVYSWAKENGYLTSEDWSQYELTSSVMNLPTIDSATLIKEYNSMYRKMYFRPKILLRRLGKIRTWDDVHKYYIAFRALISRRN